MVYESGWENMPNKNLRLELPITPMAGPKKTEREKNNVEKNKAASD
jgi:hypothetical protein